MSRHGLSVDNLSRYIKNHKNRFENLGTIEPLLLTRTENNFTIQLINEY